MENIGNRLAEEDPFAWNRGSLEMASASAFAPSRSEVLSLFRELLRTARQFCDYNVKEYTKRRTIDAFRRSGTLSDPSSISSAYSDGRTQLEVAKRQVFVHSLYTPKIKSIMEMENFIQN